jgi:hypothetical protein
MTKLGVGDFWAVTVGDFSVVITKWRIVNTWIHLSKGWMSGISGGKIILPLYQTFRE